MKDFIIDNWQFLVAIFVSVVSSLVVWLIRKKPVINEIDTILLMILEKLPDWILSVEALKGADIKKAAVLESAKRYAKEVFNVDLSSSLLTFIGTCIESILSAPQKKMEV